MTVSSPRGRDLPSEYTIQELESLLKGCGAEETLIQAYRIAVQNDVFANLLAVGALSPSK